MPLVAHARSNTSVSDTVDDTQVTETKSEQLIPRPPEGHHEERGLASVRRRRHSIHEVTGDIRAIAVQPTFTTRRIELIRLINRDARTRYLGRASVTARQEGWMERNPSEILAEAFADVYAAVKKCYPVWRSLDVLKSDLSKRNRLRAVVKGVLPRFQTKCKVIGEFESIFLRQVRHQGANFNWAQLMGDTGADEADGVERGESVHSLQ